MIKTPELYVKEFIGKQVIIHTFRNQKFIGILKGVDVYLNIFLANAKEDKYSGDILINGNNVLFIDLQ